MFTLEVVTTRDRLEQIEPEWNALADRLGTPLLRHEWFAEAAAALSPGAPLAVHVVREGARARAIAPLALEGAGLDARLRMLGAQNYEPEAFLWDDEEALRAACESVIRTGRPLLLLRLPDDCPELAALSTVHRGKAVVRAGSSQAYSNPIGSDWAALEQAMATKKRNELSRRRRKLEDIGPLSFEILTPDPEAFVPLYETFVRLEASGWKGRDGTAIAHKPDARAFYDRYGRRLARAGALRFSLLRLGGELVAAQYLVEHAGKIWALKIAYDERFSAHSPGALLTHDVLRWASANGLTSFEHLGVAEDWQRRWPVEVQSYSSLRLYPANVRGAAALALDAAQHLRRRLGSKRPGSPPPPRARSGSARNNAPAPKALV